ncbi:MAG TPA: winged helix-turn-helix domain-containing protein [Stellaceae bacterium]|nr:winged helix-turn-helix domain-containing protein [Stellaceae bacterium]
MADESPLTTWAGGTRVSLAIVFTDVVKGTSLGTNLGDDKMNAVKADHYSLARAKIAERNGRFIKTIGDAVMAVFKAASDAVEFARLFHDEPGAPDLLRRVRAGVHIGEVDVKDADHTPADVWGSEVDFAARVVAAAEGAEIWLSDQAMTAFRRRIGRFDPAMNGWVKQVARIFPGFEDEPPATLWSLSSPATGARSGPADEPLAQQVSPSLAKNTARTIVGFEFGDFLLDIERHELRRLGEQIPIEPQVFDLLVYLVRNRERVVSRDDLIDAVWGGRIASDSAVTTRINAVRRAVGDSGATQATIRTVARKGVRFIAAVRERGADTVPQPDALPAMPEPAPAPTRPAILVLPFRNATGDPRQDYFTDAVTADLTVDLSRMRDIVVISAASAMTYKGSTLDTRQIGRELGVRYLLIGSIARVGELVRTNIQLVDAASGEQLWGDRFEHEFVDLGGLENAITGRIAASLNVQLVRAEGRRAEKTVQPGALDLRLHATSLFFGSIAPEHTMAVRELLQRSVDLDSTSAEAWARLAEVTVSDHLNQWNSTGKEQVREAEEAVHKALLIDPNNALAHVASGLIHRSRGEHHSALEAFSRAIELDPNFAFAHAHKGSELIYVGRPAEAAPFVEQALRLSPHDPHIGIFHWILGRAHFYAGQYGEAVSWLHRSVRARPNLWYNRLHLVSAYALLGQVDEAARALAEFNRRFAQPPYTLALVKRQEDTNPNSNPTVVAAREKFHEGLIAAGMAKS